MTHFELFYELLREHLITIWELPLYSMKFFSRPMNVGICTLFIKCMCVYFNFFGMYEGPQNIQIQIQGRSVAACYIKWTQEWSRNIWSEKYQRHLWHKETQMGHVTWNKVGSQQKFVDLKCWWQRGPLQQGSTRYAFWVFVAQKQKR